MDRSFPHARILRLAVDFHSFIPLEHHGYDTAYLQVYTQCATSMLYCRLKTYKLSDLCFQMLEQLKQEVILAHQSRVLMRGKRLARALVYSLLHVLPEEPASDFHVHDTQAPLDLLSSRYLLKPSAKTLSARVLPHFIS